MSARLPHRCEFLFARHVGRWGCSVTKEWVADKFGRIGSNGWTFHVSIWKNPR